MRLSKGLQIFLLYARPDEDAVRQLYCRLREDGANVWMDKQKLLAGQDWQYEIRNAIHSSDLVIACLSERFNQGGGYRHEELRIALEKAASLGEGNVFIIPARLEECAPPEPLSRWQRVDLFESDGYQQLLAALMPFLEG